MAPWRMNHKYFSYLNLSSSNIIQFTFHGSTDEQMSLRQMIFILTSMVLFLMCANDLNQQLRVNTYISIQTLTFIRLYVLYAPLQLSLNMVPKILAPLVKDWAPQAFVISFKLETDATILLEKAQRALETYRHQAVVANVLDSRRGYVVVVTPTSQDELILTEDDERNEVEIEDRIVRNLTSAHDKFITQQGS